MVISDKEFKKLAPKAKKCMTVGTAIGSAFCIIPAIIVWLVLYSQEITLPPWAHVLFAAWVALWLIYLLVAPGIRYRRYRYLIDEEKIVVREGLWFITEQFAPIERVHQIAVKSGPIDRLYGLAKIIATTAGGMVSIAFLENHIAEEMADNLQIRVRHILAQQGISLQSMEADADE